MRTVLISGFVLLLGSCTPKQRPAEPAIYYWKSSFHPGAFEKRRLDRLEVHTLYVKFFDIAWNAERNQALPIAKILIRDTAYWRQQRVIPTVFITNEVFAHLDSTAVKTLAAHTSQLIQKYLDLYPPAAIPELQMDCDWTASTKDKYFYFLTELKRLQPKRPLSATIRLHQVKYTRSSGVPPVDRGLLMCYNMGNLQILATDNSILDPREFEKYSAALSSYPLRLDIGLPLFEWYVLFRDHRYGGLFHSLPAALIKASKVQNGNRLKIIADTTIGGRRLQRGDILRHETSSLASIRDIIKQLDKKLPSQPIRVVLYHCDSVILNKYTTYELENIYSGLRHD